MHRGPLLFLVLLFRALFSLLLKGKNSTAFTKKQKKERNQTTTTTGPSQAPPRLRLAPRRAPGPARRFLPQRLAALYFFFFLSSTPSEAPFLHGGALRLAQRGLQASRGLWRALERKYLFSETRPLGRSRARPPSPRPRRPRGRPWPPRRALLRLRRRF